MSTELEPMSLAEAVERAVIALEYQSSAAQQRLDTTPTAERESMICRLLEEGVTENARAIKTLKSLT